MAQTYILYSHQLDKYYVGSTEDCLNERLRRHLSDHKGFTAKAKDWVIVFTEEHPNLSDARKREIQIKSWKSRSMILKLLTQTK